ncbi:MAG: hypothetical protein NVS4B11_12310 [Ktedonobacteraceae bacterium]
MGQASSGSSKSGNNTMTCRVGRPHGEQAQAGEGEGIIRSPSDPKARMGRKRELFWFGYTPLEARHVVLVLLVWLIGANHKGWPVRAVFSIRGVIRQQSPKRYPFAHPLAPTDMIYFVIVMYQ